MDVISYGVFGLVHMFVIGNSLLAGDATSETTTFLGGELALLVPLPRVNVCTSFNDGHLCLVYAVIHLCQWKVMGGCQQWRSK